MFAVVPTEPYTLVVLDHALWYAAARVDVRGFVGPSARTSPAPAVASGSAVCDDGSGMGEMAPGAGMGAMASATGLRPMMLPRRGRGERGGGTGSAEAAAVSGHGERRGRGERGGGTGSLFVRRKSPMMTKKNN